MTYFLKNNNLAKIVLICAISPLSAAFAQSERVIDVPAITVKKDKKTGEINLPFNFPS